VKHLHYIGWPDWNSPNINSEDIVDFDYVLDDLIKFIVEHKND
jgi:hypothetical protein